MLASAPWTMLVEFWQELLIHEEIWQTWAKSRIIRPTRLGDSVKFYSLLPIVRCLRWNITNKVCLALNLRLIGCACRLERANGRGTSGVLGDYHIDIGTDDNRKPKDCHEVTRHYMKPAQKSNYTSRLRIETSWQGTRYISPLINSLRPPLIG